MSLGMVLGLGPGDFVLDCTPLSSPKARGKVPKFSAHVYCGQTAGWMKLVLAMEVGLSPDDFMLDGNPAPRPRKGAPCPIFGLFLLWLNGWMDKDATSHEDSLSPGDSVTETQLPLNAHACCNQTAGWITMSFRMEVDLGPGHIVLDGVPAIPP